MRRLVSILALLLAFSVVPARADRCDEIASAIATKAGLKTGKRTEVNIPLQPLNIDADDEHSAYLNCAEAPRGMSLSYAHRGDPPQGWFDFVGRTAAVLTGLNASLFATEARGCIEKARPRGYFESTSSVLIGCDTESSGVPLLVTER